MMKELIQKSLSAKRESKYIEYKSEFDPNFPGEWCEVIKDIVAMANSGGGIIVFGLSSTGVPTGNPVDLIAGFDPADIANKISKYTGPIDLELEIESLEKDDHSLVAFIISPISIPLVFQNPGTYNIGSGRQKTAFGRGTIYFRHGAKSEPGTSEDIRRAFERHLEYVRRSWIKGIRKIVKAPPGSQVVTLAPAAGKEARSSLPVSVRVVNDPTAIPVRLTRNPMESSGSFVHEEMSDGIFDEINNVIDANRVLAKGQPHFLFEQPIYYRIYAERHHVRQSEATVSMLLNCAVSGYYAPFAFWTLFLPEKLVAQALATLYFNPKSPNIYNLMRVAILLGTDFTSWLREKLHSKWPQYRQSPPFYRTFNKMISDAEKHNPRIVAAPFLASAQISIMDNAPVSVEKLRNQPELSASLLSKACIQIFKGDKALKNAARALDYFAYSVEIQRRAPELAKAIIETIGDKSVGDSIEDTESE